MNEFNVINGTNSTRARRCIGSTKFNNLPWTLFVFVNCKILAFLVRQAWQRIPTATNKGYVFSSDSPRRFPKNHRLASFESLHMVLHTEPGPRKIHRRLSTVLPNFSSLFEEIHRRFWRNKLVQIVAKNSFENFILFKLLSLRDNVY